MKSADYVCSNPTHRLTDITSILVEVKTQAIPETMETKQNITSNAARSHRGTFVGEHCIIDQVLL